MQNNSTIFDKTFSEAMVKAVNLSGKTRSTICVVRFMGGFRALDLPSIAMMDSNVKSKVKLTVYYRGDI